MTKLINLRNEFFSRWSIPNLIIDEKLEKNNFKLRIFRLFRNYEKNIIGMSDVRKLDINYDEFINLFPNSSTFFMTTAECVKNFLEQTNDFMLFLFHLELLVNDILFYSTDIKEYKFLSMEHEAIINDLRRCFEYSAINIDFVLSDNNDINNKAYVIKFYPKGDITLDSKLVNEVVPLLNESSGHEYKQALNFYLRKDYVQSANHLRKTLEIWLKEVFHLEKTLDNILNNLDSLVKKELNQRINDKLGIETNKQNMQISYISQFIGKTFPVLIDLFKKYELPHNNGGIKHGSVEVTRLLEPELEFMLYQTGSIIRFINKILNIDINLEN